MVIARGLFAGTFILACSLSGDQNEEPTFRATTRLVEMAVVAVDVDGRPVKDLKKADVVLKEAGKTREVAFLQFEGGPPVKPAPLAKGMFSNRLEFDAGPARNVTALLVDTLNTSVQHQLRVRGQVARYLREIPSNTRVALYHLGKTLNVLHDFTADPEALRRSFSGVQSQQRDREETDVDELAKQFDALLESGMMAPGAAKSISEMLRIEAQMNGRIRVARIQATLSALSALGRYLSQVPGRKNLVWITGGLPLVMNLPGARGPELTSFQGQLRDMAQRLAQAGVALYIVDARGIEAPQMPGPQGAFAAAQRAYEINDDIRLASMMMANITGGRFINYTNDASDGLREAVTDMEGSYTLGFYTGADPDGKWHDLTPASTRPGVKLRFQSGYIAEKDAPVEALGDADWRKLISSGEPARGVPIQAFAEKDPKSGSLMLQAYFHVSGILFRGRDGVMEAEVDSCLAEISAEGRVQFQTDSAKLSLSPQEWKLVQTASVPWARAWKPREDTVRVKLLLRDRSTGVHGALEIPLDRVAQ